MPSPASEQLVAGYKLQQYNAAQAMASYVVGRWALHLATQNPRWGTAWITEVLPLMIRAREKQRPFARAYYQTLRILETGDRTLFDVPEPPPTAPEQLSKSLSFVGLKDLEKRDQLVVREQLEGAVIKHTLNAGREQVAAAQQADPRAVGYYRETDGDPCHFCGMLASRGAVYKEDSFDESDPRFEGEGTAKVHDKCGCHNRPIWTRDILLPEVNRRAFDTWMSLTGKDAYGQPIEPQREFRQRWEGRYEQPDAVVL